ncbi:9123_t:CDS:2 [Paraglomus brasilianum]|uniref:9123_t:CDS:1 n=1 Tax=Paraglomus brasilianum TaxID=144538 RepID=A0A9N9CXB1_9GLOM|nr:9123_t:CDS:2 [Paraglomus brasilianum]
MSVQCDYTDFAVGSLAKINGGQFEFPLCFCSNPKCDLAHPDLLPLTAENGGLSLLPTAFLPQGLVPETKRIAQALHNALLLSTVVIPERNPAPRQLNNFLQLSNMGVTKYATQKPGLIIHR